jgi:TonB family protein
MNRLQKKCLITTAGFHLLVVTLVCCSGFFTFTRKSKPDDTPLLTVIPANLIDAEFNSGVKGAQPPAPTPTAPPQPPEPQPPQPKPPEPVKPVEPVKPPEPTPIKPQKLSPDDLKPTKPVERPVKPEPKKPEISLKPVVRNTPKVTDTTAAEAAREKREREARLRAITSAARAIKDNSSTSTTVDMPGTGSVSYANYASVVKSIYTQAWIPPDDTASDDANTRVSVTIGSDGTVISSRILNPSGDSRVDGSVQRTLDRVTFVAPFPDGAKEKQRTFIINFNLKAKRMLG